MASGTELAVMAAGILRDVRFPDRVRHAPVVQDQADHFLQVSHVHRK